MAPFTEGDPHFTQRPVAPFSADARIHANTMAWDRSEMSGVVSPSSVAWTHLKGVTWAKNFQAHFDVLPAEMAPRFRSQMLATVAQLAIKATLVDGGPENDGALTKGDSLELVSEFDPERGEDVDGTTRPAHHATMLWFLSDMTSLANGGWYGYVNPKPLIPAKKIQQLADDGRLRTDSGNQAAIQGVVGQGLLWASRIPGANHEGMARSILEHLLGDLWNDGAGTFADGSDDGSVTITARDAGDITGGINAADAVLGIEGARETYARSYDQTFNRGGLQRAERPQSRNRNAEYPLPLPQNAGGEYGQATVYNTEAVYDADAEEW